MRYLLVLLSAAALASLNLSFAAESTANKFPHAIERSKDAARIVSLLATPESEMPKELMARAKAIGIFLEVRKETAVFSSTTMGYGVISARLKNGWSAPAFYAFGGGGYGNPFAKNEKMAVLMLFLTEDAVAAFEKGGLALKNEKHADAGPVGELSDEQRKDLADAKIVAYTYYNGKLNGTTFGRVFGRASA
jgi:SH3 domain-containing YSC84-like protein 1